MGWRCPRSIRVSITRLKWLTMSLFAILLFMGLDAGITYGFLFVFLYFEVFLLVTFIQRRLFTVADHAEIDKNSLPKIAVIVPCFNEEQTVEGTLLSLLALDYPQDKLEVIAVDDGSTDNTLRTLEQFRSDPRVRIFTKENGGKHTAMNLGLKETGAELIGCLDADSEVAPNALLIIAPLFQNEKISAVTPGIHVKAPRTILQHMQHVEYQLSIFNRYVFATLGSIFVTPGPFSFFRASVVRELGGWHYAHSTEDMEMALRMQAAGHLIANAPKAIVHTSTPRTLLTLFRQRVRWTYGWLRNAVDYRHMFGNRAYGNLGIIVLPSAFISIGAGIFFFSRIMWNALLSLHEEILSVYYSGVYPHVSFDLFYINTSIMFFIVFAGVTLMLIFICAGSFISTGHSRPPLSPPLFLLFYSFLVPMWLGVAIVRATLKTGVRWR